MNLVIGLISKVFIEIPVSLSSKQFRHVLRPMNILRHGMMKVLISSIEQRPRICHRIQIAFGTWTVHIPFVTFDQRLLGIRCAHDFVHTALHCFSLCLSAHTCSLVAFYIFKSDVVVVLSIILRVRFVYKLLLVFYLHVRSVGCSSFELKFMNNLRVNLLLSRIWNEISIFCDIEGATAPILIHYSNFQCLLNSQSNIALFDLLTVFFLSFSIYISTDISMDIFFGTKI